MLELSRLLDEIVNIQKETAACADRALALAGAPWQSPRPCDGAASVVTKSSEFLR